MTTIVDSALDYSQNPVSHPTYKYVQVNSLTNSGSATINTSGGQDLVYELPQNVMNFSKSYATFNMSCPALASNSTNIFCDTVPFRQLQCYNAQRKMVVDFEDVNKYINMVNRYETAIEEILTNDRVEATTAWTMAYGLLSPLSIAGNTLYDVASTTAYAINGTVGAPTTPDGTFTALNSTRSRYYNFRPFDNANTAYGNPDDVNEPRYLLMGTGTNAVNACKWHIPFTIFKNTILSMNKDFLFNSAMYLRFVFAPSTQIYFTSTATNNPYTGSATAVGSVTISNFYVYVAQEQNPVIIQELQNKVASGMTIDIPWVYQYRTTTGATGGYNLQTRYNRGHGKRLSKILWAPYSGTETGLTTYDHNNLCNSGTMIKVSQFYASVNNRRLHEFNLSCSNGDDYLISKNALKGSCILSAEEYLYNFVWRHCFSNDYNALDYPLSPSVDNRIDGLDLTTEQIIDINVTTTSANLVHYVFGIVMRQLNITNTMVDVS